MVLPDSDRITRVPPYSGTRLAVQVFAYGTITLYGHSFQSVLIHNTTNVVVLQPQNCRNNSGLGYSAFARRYLRNHSCFLLLRVLRCFSSPGSLPRLLGGDMSSTCRVAPFGHLRIISYVPIPAAFRSLSRPSSPPGAKASPIRPYLLLTQGTFCLMCSLI